VEPFLNWKENVIKIDLFWSYKTRLNGHDGGALPREPLMDVLPNGRVCCLALLVPCEVDGTEGSGDSQTIGTRDCRPLAECWK